MAANIGKRLTDMWLQERFCPELLPYEQQLVDFVLDEIRAKEEMLESVESATQEQQFVANVYRMELERITYVLRCYLKQRIEKIERHFAYIIQNDDMIQRLSEAESRYLDGYTDLMGAHLHNSFLTQLSGNHKLHELDENTSTSGYMITPPPLDSHVFCRALEDIGEFHLDQEAGNTIRLTENDIWVVRYRPIRPLVEDGRVELI